jgi:NADH dehydrogenase FAD-containing subunit
MSEQKTILIIGGSFSGMSIAHYVLKHVVPKLPSPSSYVVTIVSASTHFMIRQAAPRALVSPSLIPYDRIFTPLEPQFSQYPRQNFNFVHAVATSLDHVAQTVKIQLMDSKEERVLAYHALVLATGGRAQSPLHGLQGDHTTTLDAWKAFQTALPKAKSIVIAGGGPTGVETAGELGEYLNGRDGGLFFWRRKRGAAAPEKVSITLVNASGKLLPVLRDEISNLAEAELGQVGVNVIKNAKVESIVPSIAGQIEPGTRNMTNLTTSVSVSLSNGQTLDADLYIPSFGFRPNSDFIDPSLLNESGHVKVDVPTLKVPGAGPRVYVAGDVGGFPRSAVHMIYEQVPILSTNLKLDLMAAAAGDESDLAKDKYRNWEPDLRETQLVPIGSRGVGAAQGYKLPSFFVWLIKGRDYWISMMGGTISGKQWAKEQ